MSPLLTSPQRVQKNQYQLILQGKERQLEFRGSTGGRQRRRGSSREVRDPRHNMHVVAQLKVTDTTPSVTAHYEVCRPRGCRAPTFLGVFIHQEDGGLQGFFYRWLNWQTKCTNAKICCPAISIDSSRSSFWQPISRPFSAAELHFTFAFSLPVCYLLFLL